MSTALATTLALLLVTHFVIVFGASSYLYDGYGAEDFPVEGPSENNVDRGDLSVDRFIQGLNKRSCIRRGLRCDHRPDDCCSGGSCRCNLWGSNCQCQRMGIFQKWG